MYIQYLKQSFIYERALSMFDIITENYLLHTSTLGQLQHWASVPIIVSIQSVKMSLDKEKIMSVMPCYVKGLWYQQYIQVHLTGQFGVVTED